MPRLFKNKLINQLSSLFILLSTFMPLRGFSQGCGTIVSASQQSYLDSTSVARANFQVPTMSLVPTTVPVQIHVVRTSSGSGGVSNSTVNSELSTLNSYYSNANMTFVQCGPINYIDNSTWYNYDYTDEAAITGSNNVAGVINIYFTNTITSGGNSLCGYTYLPPSSDVIFVASGCTGTGNTLSHEIGHYFSLYHTHGTTNNGFTDELVNGSNCSTAGDRLCDTEADPNLYYNSTLWVNAFCQYFGIFVDANGQSFNPNTNNIMSYSRPNCRNLFTNGQYSRIAYSLQNDRNYLSCSGNPNQADLIVQNPTASSTTIQQGATTSLSCTVRNQGSSSTGSSSRIGYYLSSNTTLGSSDIYLGDDYVSTLSGGSTSSESETVTIPSSTSCGNWYILFVADYQSDVSESDENNNVSYQAVTVTGCTSSGADLIVQSQVASPTSIPRGNSTSLNCTVHNQGSSSTGSSSRIGYYLSSNTTLGSSDVYLGDDYVTTLSAGNSSNESESVTIPSSTSCGNWYILFVADYQFDISESDENNNVSYQAVTVTGCTSSGADLIVQSQVASPTSIPRGNSTSLNCTVHNQGSSSTGSSSRIGYYLSSNTTLGSSDVYLGDDYVTTLSAGNSSNESESVTIPSSTSCGNWYILFVADYQFDISESDENNNVSYQAVTVTGCTSSGADLVVQSQSSSNTTISAGSSTTITCSVLNQGGSSTGSSSRIGYYLSSNTTLSSNDVYLGDDYVSTLSAGSSSSESESVTIPASTVCGTMYILFVADYQFDISESNENNNVAYRSIFVTNCNQGDPDLVVQNQSISPSSVAIGGTLVLGATVTNQGTGSTGGTSRLGYYLSDNNTLSSNDVYLGYDQVSTLAAGASNNESFSYTIPTSTSCGTWYILFVADHLNGIAETNESNNVAYSTLTITGCQPDLIVHSQSASPVSVNAGGTTFATATVQNIGQGASGSSYLGYYLSLDTTWDSSDQLLSSDYVTSLNPGSTSNESATLTIPSSTTCGTWFILYVADHLSAVAESNEQNNTRHETISVTGCQPDLVVQNLVVNPTVINVGGPVFTSVNVLNQGSVSSGSNELGYYLSSDLTWDPNDLLLGTDYVGSLSPNFQSGETANLTIPATTPCGSWYILFVADHQNGVPESNEANNVAPQSITVTGCQSDLVVQSQFVTPVNISPGSIAVLNATVLNQGQGPSGGSVLGYYLSTDTLWDSGDQLLGTDAVSGLGVNATSVENATVTIPSNTICGTWHILYVADHLNGVSESNEANNVAYQPFSVVNCLPDLVVSNPTASPTSLGAGGSTNLSCTVANQGLGSSGGPAQIGYYLSYDTIYSTNDILLGTDQFGSLNPGGTSPESESVTLPSNLSCGTRYILFVADDQYGIVESNEQNNVEYISIAVVGCQPDLVVINQNVSPANVSAGGSLNSSCYVQNIGMANAGGPSELGYFLSSDSLFSSNDQFLGSDPVGNLIPSAAGLETAYLPIPANTSCGPWYILFVADYQMAVSESNETNNTAHQSITVSNCPQPDLVIQNPGLSVSSITAGSSLMVNCNVSNTGGAMAGPSTLGYYLSDDQTWSSNDVQLSAGNVSSMPTSSSYAYSTNVTIPSGTACMNGYILFVADIQNNVTESNENNNVSALAISILSGTTASMSGLASHYCLSDPDVSLTGYPAGGVFSGPGINGSFFTPSNAGPGTHLLSYTHSSNGCTSTAYDTVTVEQSPVVTVSSSANFICPGEQVSLVAQGAANYLWQPGNLIGQVINVSPGTSTTYSVTGSSLGGCSDSAAITIVVNPQLNVGITPLDTEICSGSSTTLIASGGNNYLWLPGGQTSPAISVSPATSTSYSLIGYGSACPDTAHFTLQVFSSPIAAFSYNSMGNSVSFSDNSNGQITSWHWDFGDGNTSQSQNPSHSYGSNGVYAVSLVATDFNGCSDTVSQAVGFVSSSEAPFLSSEFLIFPNPAEEVLQVQLKDDFQGVVRVEIYNGLGQAFWSGELQKDGHEIRETIDVTGFAAGPYFIRVIEASHIQTKTFFKN